MTRIVYLNVERYLEEPSSFTRFVRGLSWPVRNFDHNFNFRYADIDAERTCRYDIAEHLSATDSTVVVIRKVLAEYARGVHKPEELEGLETREESIVAQRYEEALQTSQSTHTEDIKHGLAETGFPVR